MHPIHYLSATELVQKIQDRLLSVAEVMQAFLDRIAAHNEQINAVVVLRPVEELMTEAKQKDEALQAGQTAGRLFGLPMTVKDAFWVKGLRNTNGDPLAIKNIADQDAELIRRLKAEGAIIMGKTNLPLYSLDWQSTNWWYGQTNNPYDITRVPGGSSGGAAAAVAAGFSPVELGADAGGSVRVPAHFCGICGFRPTEFILSNRGHVQAKGKALGRRQIVTPGPFGKNVADVRLMMNVLGANAKYPQAELPGFNFEDQPAKPITDSLNFGFAQTINDAPVDQEYAGIFAAFLEKLRAAGHTLTAGHPTLDEKTAFIRYGQVMGFETGTNSPRIPFFSRLLYLFFRFKYNNAPWAKGMASGLRSSIHRYAKAVDYKDAYADAYGQFLSQYDAWLTPVCGTEAFPHHSPHRPLIINGKKEKYMRVMSTFTFTTAFSGHPIAVIPIGRKANGLPVGIQIHAPKWQDMRLLNIAERLECLTEGFIAPKLPAH